MSATPISKVVYEFECEDCPSLWRVHRFSLREGINQCFLMQLEIVTKELQCDPQPLLGASVTLRIARDGTERFVSGIVTALELPRFTHDSLFARLRVEPAFRLLKQSSHCRIFQEMSVQDIVQDVLTPLLAPYQRQFEFLASERGMATRDYCVQYRESDFDFVVRLLEEEGINFHFDMTRNSGTETLMFTDANAQLLDCVNIDGSAMYPIRDTGDDLQDMETLRRFEYRQKLRTTSASRCDWDWENASILRQKSAILDGRGRERALDLALGRRWIEDDLVLRLEDVTQAQDTRSRFGEGYGHAVGLEAGKIFEVDGYEGPASLSSERFLLVSMRHEGHCPEELLADDTAVDTAIRYRNEFRCVDAASPWRPESSTQKPIISGPQTAIVTGPAQEEIYTDEHGRIKVRFHWDISETPDERSTCWIRVAQLWSGPGWGTHYIPRVGMEVVVEFLEGNPDRPLVTGCVYNGKNPFPYPLPDQKTRSGVKSQSSLGGGGFNEIRFEDAKGSEELFVHAQKDMNTKVLNNNSRSIDANDTHTVGGNQQITVHGNVNVKIEGEPKKGGDAEVNGRAGNDFKGSSTEVTGQHHVRASEEIYMSAPDKITLEVPGSSIVMEPGKITLEAGDGAKIVLDANALMQSAAGSRVFLDANALTESSAGSKVLLDANSLNASSTGSSLELTAAADLTGLASATIKAPMVNSNADGVNTVTGATVKLN